VSRLEYSSEYVINVIATKAPRINTHTHTHTHTHNHNHPPGHPSYKIVLVVRRNIRRGKGEGRGLSGSARRALEVAMRSV